MTQSQKDIIKNIDTSDSYSFYKQLDNGDIKLLSTTSLKTLTLSVEDIKYLLDNELLEVEGLKVTAAGRIAITPGLKHKANPSKIEQFKQNIQNGTNEQKEDQLRQREEQLKQIQEQHKKEHRAELKRKALERTNILKTVFGLLDDFKRPNQNKQFRETTTQENVSSTQNNIQDTVQHNENIEIQENITQQNSLNMQQAPKINRASQYAQRLNNPNLDFDLR